MKIKKLKINSYGKIKNKEINLENNINMIYGKNESGKSTILNFIFNILYGISKNKNGKEISDYEKYKPWNSEEYSGKITYELDNKNNYEIFREFNKKNPQIFNEKGEEISNKFNINKKTGNEFFYEQTHIEPEMYLSTSTVLQQEVKIGKNIQNLMVQKISNLLGTGEDDISYKKTLENLNKMQLENIGTERSKEKPINIIQKKSEENNKKIKELKNNENLQQEIEEKIKELKKEINEKEIKNNLLKEIKNIYYKKEINNEKIKIKEKISEENKNKKELINEKIKNKNFNFEEEKNNNKKIENIKSKKIKKIKKYNFILITLIIINLLFGIYEIKKINNNILNILLFLPVPLFLIYYYFKIKKINKNINEEKNKIKNIKDNNDAEIIELKNSLKAIDENMQNINKEIEKEKNNNLFILNMDKEELINKYLTKISKEEINELFNSNNIEKKIEINEREINNLKYELNKLEFQNESIEKELENLSVLKEKQEQLEQEMLGLQEENQAIELTKNLLEKAYEKMKNNISPIFTEKLSKNISKITDGKYQKILFNDEQGLIVELENGNYISADRLSIGTIDQLYLSLRFAMLDEISTEKVPIILDESFAYFDDERLKNILLFLNNEYKDRQIIIFTCTNREKIILNENNVDFNFIKL